jgi:hypothetical protein
MKIQEYIIFGIFFVGITFSFCHLGIFLFKLLKILMKSGIFTEFKNIKKIEEESGVNLKKNWLIGVLGMILSIIYLMIIVYFKKNDKL